MKQIKELGKKITLITHKDCGDGSYSAIVLKKYAEDNNIELEIILEQYGKKNAVDIIDKFKNKSVIMCDFSYRRDIIELLHKATNENLVALDHHASAKKILDGLDYCLFDMNKSGAMLMWDYLYKDKTPPKAVQYIQDRDLWNWNLPDSKEFSAGIALYTQEDLVYGNPPENLLSDKFVKECIAKGNPVVQYQNAKIKSKCKDKSKMKLFIIDGFKVPCINSTHLISEIGNELAKEMPFSAQYFITETEIVFSLRSIENIGTDVSKIAVKYGGGGHPEAASFSFKLDEINLNTLFTTNDLDKVIKGTEDNQNIEVSGNVNDLKTLNKRCEEYFNNNYIEKDITKELLFWYVVYEPFKDLDIDIRISDNKNKAMRLCADGTYLSFTEDNVIKYLDRTKEMKTYNSLNELIDLVDKFIKGGKGGDLLNIFKLID